MKDNFNALGISREMVDLLKLEGITEPTSIQTQAIPILLSGRDIIGQAQTGTGKTLAFILPMMERIDTEKQHIQSLIITPTRELAIQITAEARKLAAVKGINILAAYGGQDVEQQIRKLKGNIHMVIGTPGRLLDHLRRKSIDLSRLHFLVLDEADQMLHMGFLKEVEDILRQTPKKRQTMLFSATMPKEVRSIALRHMDESIHIRVHSERITLDEIHQVVIETTDRGKQAALCKVIDEYRPFMAIIFCRTKRRVTALNEALQQLGYNSDELHGDLTQAKREKVMSAFRKMQIQLLVATDVAARGLDIEGVTHVFNYDVPQDAESYIHRIGRTGRAGQKGMAVTFATSKDREALNLIESGINMRIKRSKGVKKSELKERKASSDEDRSNKQKATNSPRGKAFGRNKTSANSKRNADTLRGADKKHTRGKRQDNATKKHHYHGSRA
ncbi:ATP-dependent RNA helicase DeaD [Geosporobacter subterraneus DSM 17957]|uniref:ATP-dependent RNA helicase DeaD n=1 Tax=Geosporobacter subterraneus DSM 17957 TaxID=1121919 RepID=A0A1M6H4D6_9FIRM|nr:DEAD/DEAH box helicase [Geosporobacter subterraneus]SHJ16989.1 ATP-dependent RNA helicase DeaD [Geosporobacter subterraneus DSM 17957]